MGDIRKKIALYKANFKTTFLFLFLIFTLYPLLALAEPLELLTFDYYPTMYKQGGEIKGCAVCIVKEALQRMGCKIHITMVPYKRGLFMIRAGKADAMFTVYKTPEREKFAYYPALPVMYRVVSFYALKDSTITFGGDLHRMTHYSIGTVRGYSYGKRLDSLIRQGAFEKIDPATDPRLTLKKLLHKRFDLMPHTEVDMLYLQKEMECEGKIKKLSPAVEKVSTYLIFSKKKQALAQLKHKFSEAINEMMHDGTYERLYYKTEQ